MPLDRSQIEQIVESEGFTLLGIVRPDVGEDMSHFRAWLDAGKHAGMGYLENNLHLREDPKRLLDGAIKSILVVGLFYRHEIKDVENKGPRVAKYARLKDYHKLIWRGGESIAKQVEKASGVNIGFRVTADSAPILERALASRTGAGFIGKNTCFISASRGSFVLLGEILLDIELPIDSALNVDSGKRNNEGGCGTCRRCQVHCPTGALSEDYKLDANECLAYWTIEHRGAIPTKFWRHLDAYVFGCDICQDVCPYNRRKNHRLPPKFQSNRLSEILSPSGNLDLYRVALMSEREYQNWFGGTPLTRAKRDGLRRNALIAMYVTKDVRLNEVINCLRENMSDLGEGVLQTLDQIASAKRQM